MNLKNVANLDDRGASTVIGVILMVAVTVILASVVGALVLGQGNEATTTPPQASFEFTFESSSVATITHEGGEDLTASDIEVTVGDEVMYEDGSAITAGDLNNSGWTGDAISSGQTLELKNTSADYSDETIRIVWNDPSGGSSNSIADREWGN